MNAKNWVYISFILALLISPLSYSQSLIEKQENLLGLQYEKLWNMEYDEGKASENFKSSLKNFLDENPETLTYNFKNFGEKPGVSICTSEDGLFRIYSWNTFLGGTMHDYEMIYQYKSKGKIYTEYGKFYNPEIRPNTGTFYTEIFTVKSKNSTYYLAKNFNSLMNPYKTQGVDVFEIRSGELKKDIDLFRIKNGSFKKVRFAYYIGEITPNIYYDKKSKQFYIPLVDENEIVTDKFLIYEFDGKHFRYKRVGKI